MAVAFLFIEILFYSKQLRQLNVLYKMQIVVMDLQRAAKIIDIINWL